MAVGSAIIDDGDILCLQCGGRITSQRAAQLAVVGDYAEYAVKTLLGIFRAGGGRRDLRDTGIVVDLGSRNRGARIQVADDAGDLGVDQFLRCGRALFGVGCIIFCQQDEFDFLAAQGNALGVQFFDRHLGAVFHVFAEVGRRAGHWTDMADLDDLFFCVDRTGST